ncbi:von Willebrand factor-like [Saccoglossus kowalevskii]
MTIAGKSAAMLHILVILTVISLTQASTKEFLGKRNDPSPTAYVVVNGPMSWYEAKKECENRDLVLAEPHTESENDAIQALNVSGNYWLGITDIHHDGTFTYRTCNRIPEYSNWDANEPNGYNMIEDCTEMRESNGLWNVIPCNWVLGHAVCEYWHGAHGIMQMRTFDGRPYIFQGTCWYNLFKDCTDDSRFEVTAKFEPRKHSTSDKVSTRIVAFNLTFGDQYANVDGLDITTGRTGGQVTAAHAITIHVEDKKITMNFTSRKTTFTLDWTLRKHALSVSFYGSFYRGKLCGLMGNADGNALNDFQKLDGSIAKNDVGFTESWKVREKKCD